ncbi:hypothetical protein JYU34_004419 [Plutella xylostella]|uniref:FLYWCH-type domain-containing protein n=1 Tax=Plutella xylostella TaxID=51655 RepID=A0ABQ7QXX0_PLUXY|nr:hypothetical protein JYU34_004419 [Plutella xylostella]
MCQIIPTPNFIIPRNSIPTTIPEAGITFVIGNKNKQLLLLDGYKFYEERRYTNTVAWRCTFTGCRARLTLAGRHVLRAQLLHHHPRPAFTVRNGVMVNLPNKK